MYCDDPHDYPNFYIFTSLKAIKEYYNLSASELATWRDEGECPDRDELSQIDDCTIVTLVEKKATKEITSLKEIYSFRTSEDGDHWDRCVGGFFSSMDQLVQYVEALLIDKGFMSDEDINNTCRTLKKICTPNGLIPMTRRTSIISRSIQLY